MSDRKAADGQRDEAWRWMTRADEDTQALLRLSDPAVDAAAFHCQQAVEKMAKAALIAARVPPLRVHDIESLGFRVAEIDPHLGGLFRELGGISVWYVITRYPDAGMRIGPTDAELMRVIARIESLRALIGVKLNNIAGEGTDG